MTYQSEHINELATALCKAQAKIRNAEEDKSNPHFKSRYATLTSLWECCRHPLSENGLSILQTFEETNNKLYVVTTLVHSSGQWIRSTFPINQSTKIQEMGSACTYARRYSLSSIVGIAPGDNDDDDGEKSMQRHVKPVDKQPVKLENNESQELSLDLKKEVDILIDQLKLCSQEYQNKFWKLMADNEIYNAHHMKEKTLRFFQNQIKEELKKNETV